MGFFATLRHTSPASPATTSLVGPIDTVEDEQVFVFVLVQEVRRIRRDASAEMALIMGVGKRGYEVSYEVSSRYGVTGEVAISKVVLDAEWGRACALSELGADGEQLAQVGWGGALLGSR